VHWKFIDTGARSGAFNMKYDESLAFELSEGGQSSTLHTYRWTPSAISLGHHQQLADLDTNLAAQAGIDVVRRPTGGRAILHAEELTYCVVMKTRNTSVTEIYEQISRALVSGIKLLGLSAEVEKHQPHFPSLYNESGGMVCFSSSARHEIKLDGRKLVGSAQRRYVAKDNSEVVLQHGSILMGPAHRRIVEFLKISEDERTALRSELDRCTTDIQSELGRMVPVEEVVEALRAGFEQAWGISFERREPEFAA
jgi:lipoate-protein ligase A